MKRTTQPKVTANEKVDQLKRILMLNSLSGSNVLGSRMSYGGTQTFDGKRDIYQALGYPRLDAISYGDYYLRFRRQDIAKIIVNRPVEDSWRKLPVVRVEGDKEDKFKDIWDTLNKDKGIYNKLIRSDKVSRIGRYGVFLIGVDDGLELNEPMVAAKNLLYIQPYSEDNAKVKTLSQDTTSERYGLPESYSLQTSTGIVDSSTKTIEVHHSRVVHIAEELIESNVYAIPPLECVYNRLLNMELIVGGSAEMFWQGAFPGLAFKTDSEHDLTATSAELTEEIEKYVHKMERYMKLQGIDVQNLAPAVADPSKHAELQIKMISIATRIPKRILEGSERGELSSSQDTEAWDNTMDGRRENHIEPTILRPLIDKLIAVGILEEPKDGYHIEWPDLSAPSDKDRAETGRIQAEAISKYTSSPDAQMIIAPKSFFEEIMGLPEEKVKRIMEEIEGILKTMVVDDGEGDDDLGEGGSA